MKRRRESDASLLIGLVLGIAVGAALVIILSARPDESLNFPALNGGKGSKGSKGSKGGVEKARSSLQENEQERTQGAAEAAS